jgi:hypothetical protein
MVDPSVVSIWSPGRSCWIGIRIWLVKVINVSLAKQPDPADADADAAAADASLGCAAPTIT